jgi:secretion/DNA translocation related TadE-like protein
VTLVALGRRTSHGEFVDSSGDRGSAALWSLALTMVLWVFACSVVMASIAVTARHRAATAADLAALSGASAAARSQLSGAAPNATVACAAARATALANDATLDSCDVVGAIVTVTATVRLSGLGHLLRQRGPVLVSARARAGPG